MIYELLKHLDKNKFDSTILCYAGRTESVLEKQAERDFDVQYMDETGSISFLSLCRVFKKIKNLSPDVVHAHLGGMVYAIPWAFFHKGRKLIITAHTKPKMAFNKKVEPLLKYLLRHRKNDVKVVAVSEENYIMLQSYLNVSNEVCACVNNGVDLDRFYRSDHELFTYINVARQDENKNQSAILEAFNKVYQHNNNIRLLLLGDGPFHKTLLDRVYQLNLNDKVILPGLVGDVENYYAISDVYVQASHREAMPLSVLEAMAAGLSIISTDVGGMKDIVKDNGILVEDNDDEALYNAMKDMCFSAKSIQDNMNKNSLEIVKLYSSEGMARKYEELYVNLLD